MKAADTYICSLFTAILMVAGTAAPRAAEEEDLFAAVRTNDAGKVEAMIETLGDHLVLWTTGPDVTPLHLAAARNSRAVAGLLICQGARLNARTAGGFTPLHWAAGRDAVQTADLLVKMGADVNAVTATGITPLHWAASRNATNMVSLLISAGARVMATTVDGLTPLHWAVQKDAQDAAALLAFAAVTREMDRDIEEGRLYDPNVFEMEKAMETAVGTKEPEPPAPPPDYPRASFGASLKVALGFGEELTFIWIDRLNLWFGKFEVTNGQYRRFRVKHDSLFREDFSLNANNQPAVYVSWEDADALCAWLNKNYADRLPRDCEFRLPTSQEWSFVARCGDKRIYPWGNSWPPKYGNYSDMTARKHLSDWSGIMRYEDGFPVTAPVTESGVNEWGIYGLAGNVWEWCEDWYDAGKKYRVRLGGSWDFDKETAIRIDAIGFDRPAARYDTIGVRLVAGPRERTVR